MDRRLGIAAKGIKIGGAGAKLALGWEAGKGN